MKDILTMKIRFETRELVWNSIWRLVESKRDDGVQFLQWEYKGIPTGNIWMPAVAVPEQVINQYFESRPDSES